MSYPVGGKNRSLTYTGEEKGGLDPYEGDLHLPLHYYRLSYELITLKILPLTNYHENIRSYRAYITGKMEKNKDCT